MKVISIQQPYSELIVRHGKDIENRTWKTNYRGPILIHAGKQLSKDFFEIEKQVKMEFGIDLPDWQDLKTFGIVGVADLVDCVEESDSQWWQTDSQFGFVLENARPLNYYQFPGKLSIFEANLVLTSDGESVRYQR